MATLTSALLAAALLAPAAASGGTFTIEDSRITESSGLAASRQHPGVYWTHNDSEDGPYIYGIDSSTGKTVATITLRGIGEPRDVEGISIGPGNQIFVGDIGDNLGGTWKHVWIYQFPEPKQLKDQTVNAVQYEVQYSEGPRDAEALMIHPKMGRAYIASKKRGGGAALYEGPAKLRAGKMNIFRRTAPLDLWVTDGAFSPDGERLALRGYFGGAMYDWADGKPKETGGLDVPAFQPQGESVTFASDGKALMFGTEGKQSEVTRVGLDEKDGGSQDGGGGGSEDGDEALGDELGKNRNLTLVVLTFAGATGLLVLLRRLARRNVR